MQSRKKNWTLKWAENRKCYLFHDMESSIICTGTCIYVVHSFWFFSFFKLIHWFWWVAAACFIAGNEIFVYQWLVNGHVKNSLCVCIHMLISHVLVTLSWMHASWFRWLGLTLWILSLYWPLSNDVAEPVESRTSADSSHTPSEWPLCKWSLSSYLYTDTGK